MVGITSNDRVKIPEEPLEPLCEAYPGCDAPEELERVLFAALALEPEHRVQSADELDRALAAVRAAHPELGTFAVVHARGVLHRDINANNVLIDANGGVTLLDFGAADLSMKFYDVPPGERRYLTPPEARVSIPDGDIGQLAWSAPEVRAGKSWTDKCDVYSMGHLLFRLMTGKVLHRPRSGRSVCRRRSPCRGRRLSTRGIDGGRWRSSRRR